LRRVNILIKYILINKIQMVNDRYFSIQSNAKKGLSLQTDPLRILPQILYLLSLSLPIHDFTSPRITDYHLLHPLPFLLLSSLLNSFPPSIFLPSLLFSIFLLKSLLSFYPDPRSISFPKYPPSSLLIY